MNTVHSINTYRNIFRHPLTIALLAVVISAIYGIALALSISPMILIAIPLAVVGVAITIARPELTAVALLVIEWGYISDIGIRNHGLPSISKPLVAVLLAVILIRRVVGKKPIITHKIMWWMLSYVFVVALGMWYAESFDRAQFMTIDIVKEFILLVVFVNMIRSIKELKLVLWLMLGLCALLGTLTVYQEITQTYDNEYGGLARMKVAQITEDLPNRPRAAGTTGEPLAYGQQLLVLVPVWIWGLLRSRSLGAKLFAAYATAACIAGIGLAFNRSTYIALAVVLGLYALYIKLNPKYLLLLVPLVGCLLLIAPPEFTARLSTLEFLVPGEGGRVAVEEDVSFKRRASENLMAFYMFADHPLLGVGSFNYRMHYQDYIRRYGTPVTDAEADPHNYYLEIAAEHGLLGLITWGAVLVLTWTSLRDARRIFRTQGQPTLADLAASLQIGFAGYLVSALFLHGVYSQYLWLQVGIAATLSVIAQRGLAQSPAPTPVIAPVARVSAHSIQ